MPQFRTKYDVVYDSHQEVSSESMCQSAGYVKVSDLVQQYRQAGLFLTAARQAQFDFAAGKELPENYQDITRFQDIDKFMLIDAYRSRMQTLKSQAAAQDAQANSEKEKANAVTPPTPQEVAKASESAASVAQSATPATLPDA